MSKITQFEQNVINSFRLAKSDIIKLQHNVIELSQAQEKIMNILDEIRSNELRLFREIEAIKQKKESVKVIKTNVSADKKIKNLVASKTGKKFHEDNCPYAQNIKPKNKIFFKSKTTALNEGYKPCNCINI